MNENLKTLVSSLNKSPFNRSYSLISFDSLEGLPLIQLLMDVISYIDPEQQKFDVREETVEGTSLKIFHMLKIFKYKPEIEESMFRQEIVKGTKNSIHPLLLWLLPRLEELKERAYLAKYLIKVEISQEFLQDNLIQDLHGQYLELIDSFKETHKELKNLKNSSFNTNDVKKDIFSMEDEKEQLMKRVIKLKKKVDMVSNNESMLLICRNIRTQSDQNAKLYRQKMEQRNIINQIEERIDRVQQQIKETRKAAIGMSPQNLLNRLEEEKSTNKYLALEKLPQQINNLKVNTDQIQKILIGPSISQADLDNINTQIKSENNEVNKLIEKKLASLSAGEAKIGEDIYKQQASIIKNKKEIIANNLNELRLKVNKMEEEVEEKKLKINQNTDHDYIHGQEFKKYALQMRVKFTAFKEKKTILNKLKVESNILIRTEQLLANQYKNLKEQLFEIESSRGVTGFHDTQEVLEKVSSVKSELDNKKGKSLQKISLIVEELNNKIEKKKSILAPLIKDLRPLREKCQKLMEENKESKQKYESLKASFESEWTNLEQEVRQLNDEINSYESKIHYMEMTVKALNGLVERAEKEASSKGGDKEIMLKKINEIEISNKQLKDKQKTLSENQDLSAKYAKSWRDLERIMTMKIKIIKGEVETEKENEIKMTTDTSKSNRIVF